MGPTKIQFGQYVLRLRLQMKERVRMRGPTLLAEQYSSPLLVGLRDLPAATAAVLAAISLGHSRLRVGRFQLKDSLFQTHLATFGRSQFSLKMR